MRFLVALALAGAAFAGAFTSSKLGPWSDGRTWGGTLITDPVPGVNDTAVINHAVTLTDSRTVGGCRVTGDFAVKINIGASLTFATNAALTLQGDLINAALLIGAPGAQILFDPACAGDGLRATRAYKLDFAYSGIGSSTFIADAANRGTIKTLRPNGDEAQAYVTASLPGTGGFRTLKYVDFTDMGDSSRTSLAFSAQQNFNLDYGYNTFTRCGRVAIGIGSSALQGSWRIYNNTFTSPPTASSYSLLISNYSTNPGATDVREIKNNSFAGIFGISTANTGWNVHHNVFLAGVSTATNATLFSGWHDNLYFYPAASAVTGVTQTLWGISDFANNYVANTLSVNAHVLYFPDGATAAPLAVNITDNIFEGNAPDGGGDILGIGSKPAGYRIQVLKNLVLVNETSRNPIGHLVGNPPTNTVIEHNTIGAPLAGGDPIVSIGEAVTFQRPGNVSAFRSNIFFNPYATALGIKAQDNNFPYTGGYQDIILPSGIGFNANWKLPSVKLPGTIYPNAGNGYQLNLSAPIANTGLGPQSDVDADPMFRDYERGLGWYWKQPTIIGALGQPSKGTYLADATAAVNYISQDPETRIPAVMAWVKEGYQIQNTALHNTAHDGTDVGAMPFYAPPPPPPPPSTFVLITDGGSHLYRGTCGGADHPCRLANSILALVPETGALFKPTDTSAAYQLSATATHPGIHATFAVSSFNQWTTYRTAVYLTADATVPPGRYTVTFTMSPIVGGTTAVSSKPFPLIVADPPGPLTRVANPTSNPPPARYYDEMQRVLGTAAKFCHQYSGAEGIMNPEDGPQFYDGPKVYYDLYDLTGDPQWKDCAVWHATHYEDWTIPGENRRHAFWVEGMYRHWAETAAPNALTTIKVLADVSLASVTNRYNDNGGSPDMEAMRIFATQMNTLRIAAKMTDLPEYKSARDVYEDSILTEFDAIVSGSNRNHVKSWMVGLMMQALVAYYEDDSCYPDPRIPPAVKKMADYLWQHTWVDDSDPSNVAMKLVNGMHYTTVSPIEYEYQPVPKAAPALNMLIAPAYAWVYKLTGDSAYRDKYDKMRAGWVSAFDEGIYYKAKIFGESFRWDIAAQRYLDEALLPTVLAADTTAPTISITGSQTGTATGTLTITATATDDVGIAGVEVWIRPNASDGVGVYTADAGWGAGWDKNIKYLGLATRSGPDTFTFGINLDKYTYSGTPATIYAVAYDHRRNYSKSNSLTITPSNPIAGDTTPPQIYFGTAYFVGSSSFIPSDIAAPILRVKTDVNLAVVMTDNTSTYFYMEGWVDGVKVCGDRNIYVNTYSARYTYFEAKCLIPATSTSLALGPHNLAIYVWDEAGNQATFNQVMVIMDQARAVGTPDGYGMPTTPTTFDGFNIAHGQTLSGVVPLTATASDPNGMYGIQYYVDDIPVSPIVTTPPYTYNWDTRTLPSGQHRISVYANGVNFGYKPAIALDSASNSAWYTGWAVVPMRYVYVQNTASTAPAIILRGKMTIGGATKAQR